MSRKAPNPPAPKGVKPPPPPPAPPKKKYKMELGYKVKVSEEHDGVRVLKDIELVEVSLVGEI